VSYSEPYFWRLTEYHHVASIHIQVMENADSQRVRQQVTQLFEWVHDFSVQIEKERFLSHLDPSKRLQFYTSVL
jgi:Co/Zn/Cd efflux system component